MDNSERACNAETAVDAFRSVCGTDREDAVQDLICNLMHLAAADGDDPLKVMKNAIHNYFAECNHERQCSVVLTVTPIAIGLRQKKKRSDYAAALKKIADHPVNQNSEPDEMAKALAEIDTIATVALAGQS